MSLPESMDSSAMSSLVGCYFLLHFFFRFILKIIFQFETGIIGTEFSPPAITFTNIRPYTKLKGNNGLVLHHDVFDVIVATRHRIQTHLLAAFAFFK